MIIASGGRGQRFNDKIAKQYHLLAEKPILTHTLKIILQNNAIGEVITIINANDLIHYQNAIKTINDSRLRPPVYGGMTRSSSVVNGIKASVGKYVLIHDAVRPLLSADALRRLIVATRQNDAAFLAMPVIDALWKIKGINAEIPQNRAKFWLAQTPQGFLRTMILKAYNLLPNIEKKPVDDDVAVVCAAGFDVVAVMGDRLNFKITTKQDLQIARRLHDLR